MLKSNIRLLILLLLTVACGMVQAQPAESDDQIYEFIAVEEKPVIIRDAEPVYPQRALDEGIEGTVVVTIIIDKNGNVSRAEIFSSVPQLDNAALRAARAKVFTPGKNNGLAVNTKMNIPIDFTLPGAEPAAAVTVSDQGDFVDLTGEAIRIKIEPDRPRVNIIADRIKPEFDMMDLQRSFMDELTGGGERVVITDPKAHFIDEKIEIDNIVNRSR